MLRNEVIQALLKEHCVIFPKADIKSQLLKLADEIDEMHASKGCLNYLEEKADCVICMIGLGRWCPRLSKELIRYFFAFYCKNAMERRILRKAIFKKWEKNKKRNWIMINGIYQHKEKEVL